MIDLKSIIGTNEKIIWEGKPNKKCFILESIFNPLLPFALIWAVVDTFFFIASAEEGGFFVGGFLLLHMMPVWLYLGGIIFSFRKYRNTQFIITDMGVYISGGVFSYSYDMKPWADLNNITMHRGIFDQYLGVGDVIFHTGQMVYSENSSREVTLGIINIPDYEEVFKMVKELQRDVHADTMYPNDLRPGENHGYKTKYTK